MKNIFDGIYQESFGKRRNLYTVNLTPGKRVYDEDLFKEKGVEYRAWDPFKSKYAAAILKGLKIPMVKKGDNVLYLGASTGTTVSHVSDIVGKEGFVFAVEFAPRVARELVFLAAERKNIAPILANANHPLEYAHRILYADFLYQDIAQKNQAEIFIKNLGFLKPGGYGMLCIKSRSIDITKRPRVIFNEVRMKLEEYYKVVDFRTLEPFQRDHCTFLVKK